jgi:hypothetical protein
MSPDAVIHTAQAEIAAGISILTVGLCFLPAFPVISELAGTLISDGIMDIVMELVSQGNEDFNSQEYWENKQKFYGLTLLTFGISVVTQCVTILTKALSFCRKISSFLRQSTKMRKVCEACY